MIPAAPVKVIITRRAILRLRLLDIGEFHQVLCDVILNCLSRSLSPPAPMRPLVEGLLSVTSGYHNERYNIPPNFFLLH